MNEQSPILCFRCKGIVDDRGLATRSDEALYRVLGGLPEGPRDQNIWLCASCAAAASLGELIRRGRVGVVVVPTTEGES